MWIVCTRVILALYRKTERPQRKEAEGMKGPIRKNVNYCWSERRLTAQGRTLCVGCTCGELVSGNVRIHYRVQLENIATVIL